MTKNNNWTKVVATVNLIPLGRFTGEEVQKCIVAQYKSMHFGTLNNYISFLVRGGFVSRVATNKYIKIKQVPPTITKAECLTQKDVDPSPFYDLSEGPSTLRPDELALVSTVGAKNITETIATILKRIDTNALAISSSYSDAIRQDILKIRSMLM